MTIRPVKEIIDDLLSFVKSEHLEAGCNYEEDICPHCIHIERLEKEIKEFFKEA